MLAVSLALGFGVGALMGLLGGGGSILTVPLLVYLVGQAPQVAVTTSLAIVGVNSTLGAAFHRGHGTINWRVALFFGGAGIGVSYLASGLSHRFSPDLLMVAFATLMLTTGVVMLRGQPAVFGSDQEDLRLWKVLLIGALVGLLTGILGVGGGFLIVPALVMLVGLPMHHAVGTSLVIIAMNTSASFLGHLGGLTLDLPLIAVFVTAGLAGTFVGSRLSHHLDAELLRRAFALFVIGLALFLLADNLPRLLMSG